LEGIYTTVTTEDALGNETGVDLKGFTFFKLLDKGTSGYFRDKQQTVYQVLDIFVQDKIMDTSNWW
jgi:hypothetical protein